MCPFNEVSESFSTSEWVNTIKMTGNVVPVKTKIPDISQEIAIAGTLTSLNNG